VQLGLDGGPACDHVLGDNVGEARQALEVCRLEHSQGREKVGSLASSLERRRIKVRKYVAR
jgi:hypothetical protein